jgi:hypothetical protein
MCIALCKLITDVSSVLGLLHYVDVDNVASIVRVKMCKVVVSVYIKDPVSKNKKREGESGDWCLVWARDSGLGKLYSWLS